MITNRIKIRAGLKQRQFCSNKSSDIRELKQQRRATAAKTSLKRWSRAASNFYRAYSIPLNSSNVGNFFVDLNSKRLYWSLGKGKESLCVVLTSSTKREIKYFHVVVGQWRQRNVQKSVMHVQTCCFANLNVLLFCRSRWRRRRRCLSSLLPLVYTHGLKLPLKLCTCTYNSGHYDTITSN